MALSLNYRAIQPYCAATCGWAAGSRFLGTAASRERRWRHCQPVEVEFLQRADDLSAVHGGFLLEFLGSLRAGRRAVSGYTARPDYGRGDVAEVLERAARQPQHRRADRGRSRLGRDGDD